MKFIPNGNAFIGFAATLTGTQDTPKIADFTSAVDLTPLVQGINASSTGATVPTPTFDSLWNGSIPGTVDGTFSLDSYRDDVTANDLTWNSLPRGTVGFILICRHGGKPSAAAKPCEVWPIAVSSRSVPQMSSNTAVGCTVTASVPTAPSEDAVTAA